MIPIYQTDGVFVDKYVVINFIDLFVSHGCAFNSDTFGRRKKNKQIIPTTDHIISITYIRNCIIMEIFSQKIKENTENLFLLSIQFTITD